MAVFTIGSVKGGVGKTTIATNLACWLSGKGAETLLIDADEQGSAGDFTAYREITKGETNYTLVQLTGANVRKQVEGLKTKYDHIVVDTGGRDTTSQRAAMFACDVFLAPFNPRSYDLWTVTKLCEIVEEIQATRNSPMEAFSFINRADTRSQDNRQVSEALQTYEALQFIPWLITNRKAFANSAGIGLAVFEMESPDIKAVNEIDNLFNHIINHASYPTTTKA